MKDNDFISFLKERIKTPERELEKSEQRVREFKAEAVGFRTAFTVDREEQYHRRMGQDITEAKMSAQKDVYEITKAVRKAMISTY